MGRNYFLTYAPMPCSGPSECGCSPLSFHLSRSHSRSTSSSYYSLLWLSLIQAEAQLEQQEAGRSQGFGECMSPRHA